MVNFCFPAIICFEVNSNNHDPKEYDTLQACASISVSKLYNFHLPYLVTVVNKFFFCCVSKYLELLDLAKYFVKKKCVHWSLFAKLEICWISFICSLNHPCNCLGGWAICNSLLSFVFRQTSADKVLSMSRN